MTKMVVVWAAAAGLLTAGLFWRLDVIELMIDAERVSDPRQDGGELYGRLVDLGLVTRDGDALVLAPEDTELRQAQAAGGRFVPESGRHTALTQLYDPRNSQGKAVRAAVARWNASRALVAVRDDRQGVPAAGHGPILTGDRPNLWDGADRRGRPLAPADIPVPASFAYVNGGAILPGFGDWKLFPGPHDAIRLSTALTLDQGAPVAVQVVGRLDLTGSDLPADAQVQWRCPDQGCTAATATAATVRLPMVPAGTIRLSLLVRPVAALALPVPSLALALDPDQVRRCRVGGPSVCAEQMPRWSGRPRTGRRPPGSVTILTADGVVLWRDGRPTDHAVRLGLLPVVGVDARDSWSLVGRLARRRQDRDRDVTLRLTIDSTVQQAALASLEATIHDRFAGRDDDAPYRDSRRGVLTAIDPDSGAVLAAAQSPPPLSGISAYDLGALATGDPSHDPLTPLAWAAPSLDFTPGSVWKLGVDLAGLMVARTNPTVAAMIQGCKPDAHGVLACAGLSLDQQRYLIAGQQCGKYGCGIQNFRSQSRGVETLREALDTPSRTARCLGAEASRPQTIGMAQALKISSNIWQVRLSEIMAGASARAYDAQAKRRTRQNPDLPDLKDNAVVDAASRLGLLDDDVDLLAPMARPWGPAPDRNALALAAARSDLYDLSRPQTRHGSRPTGALDALAQNAIGQRVSVAPLHLGRVAATARDGKVLVPFLVGSVNGQDIVAPAAGIFPVDDLGPLRAGMKAVVETGTAADAFGGAETGAATRTDDRAERLKNARCDVFGKTGSGQLPQRQDGRSLNAGWFVGWAEARAFAALASGRIPAWTRPLAFSCVITPVHGFIRRDNGRIEWTKTGGATCAPAVADFLSRLGGVP